MHLKTKQQQIKKSQSWTRHWLMGSPLSPMNQEERRMEWTSFLCTQDPKSAVHESPKKHLCQSLWNWLTWLGGWSRQRRSWLTARAIDPRVFTCYPKNLSTSWENQKDFSLTTVRTNLLLICSWYQRGSAALAFELRMHTQWSGVDRITTMLFSGEA